MKWPPSLNLPACSVAFSAFVDPVVFTLLVTDPRTVIYPDTETPGRVWVRGLTPADQWFDQLWDGPTERGQS